MKLNRKLSAAIITTLLTVSAITAITLAFAVPTLILDVSTGKLGDQVQVSGTTQPGGAVSVYWQNLGGALLAQGFADGLGAYSVTISVPDAAAGLHYVIVQDSTGTSAAAFTVLSSISLNLVRGIPGRSVTVTGSGFSGNSSNQQRNITILFFNTTGTTVYSKQVGTANATDTGNFTAVITVPAVDYGPYYISATDHATGTPNTADASFTVAGSVIVSPTSGPSGTIVAVSGNGLTHQAGLRVNISLNSLAAVELAPILTLADGTFSGSFIVPTAVKSQYTVYAADPNFTASTGSGSGTSDFTVTGTTGLTVSRSYGLGGDVVTLTGVNFTAIAATPVTIRIGNTPTGILQLATFTTTASGSFTGTLTVPNLPMSPPAYYINATDANGLTQTATFYIAAASVFLSPASGPTGSLVTATAFQLGTSGGTTFNVTMGGALVVASAPVGSGSSTAQFYVPTMPVGTYNLVVTDNLGFQGIATFTVTATSMLTVSPSAALADMPGVALTLTNFGASASPTFYINNATNSYPLPVSPAAPFVVLTTNASGTLLGAFTVPPLAPGSYFIVANDTSGLFTATAPFAVALNAPPIPEFPAVALMAFLMMLSVAVVTLRATRYQFRKVVS
jgi:hypothetical protein